MIENDFSQEVQGPRSEKSYRYGGDVYDYAFMAMVAAYHLYSANAADLISEIEDRNRNIQYLREQKQAIRDYMNGGPKYDPADWPYPPPDDWRPGQGNPAYSGPSTLPIDPSYGRPSNESMNESQWYYYYDDDYNVNRVLKVPYSDENGGSGYFYITQGYEGEGSWGGTQIETPYGDYGPFETGSNTFESNGTEFDLVVDEYGNITHLGYEENLYYIPTETPSSNHNEPASRPPTTTEMANFQKDTWYYYYDGETLKRKMRLEVGAQNAYIEQSATHDGESWESTVFTSPSGSQNLTNGNNEFTLGDLRYQVNLDQEGRLLSVSYTEESYYLSDLSTTSVNQMTENEWYFYQEGNQDYRVAKVQYDGTFYLVRQKKSGSGWDQNNTEVKAANGNWVNLGSDKYHESSAWATGSYLSRSVSWNGSSITFRSQSPGTLPVSPNSKSTDPMEPSATRPAWNDMVAGETYYYYDDNNNVRRIMRVERQDPSYSSNKPSFWIEQTYANGAWSNTRITDNKGGSADPDTRWHNGSSFTRNDYHRGKSDFRVTVSNNGVLVEAKPDGTSNNAYKHHSKTNGTWTSDTYASNGPPGQSGPTWGNSQSHSISSSTAFSYTGGATEPESVTIGPIWIGTEPHVIYESNHNGPIIPTEYVPPGDLDEDFLKGELEALDEKISSLSSFNQIDLIKLQKIINDMNLVITLLSNLLKAEKDTKEGIVRNI